MPNSQSLLRIFQDLEQTQIDITRMVETSNTKKHFLRIVKNPQKVQRILKPVLCVLGF